MHAFYHRSASNICWKCNYQARISKCDILLMIREILFCHLLEEKRRRKEIISVHCFKFFPLFLIKKNVTLHISNFVDIWKECKMKNDRMEKWEILIRLKIDKYLNNIGCIHQRLTLSFFNALKSRKKRKKEKNVRKTVNECEKKK